MLEVTLYNLKHLQQFKSIQGFTRAIENYNLNSEKPITLELTYPHQTFVITKSKFQFERLKAISFAYIYIEASEFKRYICILSFPNQQDLTPLDYLKTEIPNIDIDFDLQITNTAILDIQNTNYSYYFQQPKTSKQLTEEQKAKNSKHKAEYLKQFAELKHNYTVDRALKFRNNLKIPFQIFLNSKTLTEFQFISAFCHIITVTCIQFREDKTEIPPVTITKHDLKKLLPAYHQRKYLKILDRYVLESVLTKYAIVKKQISIYFNPEFLELFQNRFIQLPFEFTYQPFTSNNLTQYGFPFFKWIMCRYINIKDNSSLNININVKTLLNDLNYKINRNIAVTVDRLNRYFKYLKFIGISDRQIYLTEEDYKQNTTITFRIQKTEFATIDDVLAEFDFD